MKNPPKKMRRWAWIVGVCLMYGLGIFTQTSLERPVSTFINVGNNLGASGNVTANVISTVTHPTNLTMFSLTPPTQGVMLEVGSVQPKTSPRVAEERIVETRVMLPPMWASDEVRGIRKKFRG